MNKNETEIKQIVREAVHETLNGLGVNMSNPQEMQADFMYIRKMRKGSEMISRNIITSVVTVTIPPFLYLMWEAIKNSVSK